MKMFLLNIFYVLNEIEEQFRQLTNKFEEVNFKMDKLSSRITKMQSDNQMRFSDLENNEPNKNIDKKKAKLPGTSEPKDFGATPGIHQKIFLKNKKLFLLAQLLLSLPQRQKDQSLYFQINLLKNNMILQLVL